MEMYRKKINEINLENSPFSYVVKGNNDFQQGTIIFYQCLLLILYVL